MTRFTLICALATGAMLAACEARIGEPAEDNAAGTEQASVEGRSEAGSFSIETPGFDMKINIPEALASEINVDGDSGILYPGSTLSGMHVQANEGGNDVGSGVELRFTSADAPEQVAAWYRDPARAADFAIGNEDREGAAILLTGTEKGDGDPFTLRIGPRSGGGSDVRLTLRDRS